MQWGTPPDYEFNIIHGVPPAECSNPPICNWQERQIWSQLSTSQGQCMSFTLILHLKLAVTKHFGTKSWEAMMAIQGSLSKAHTPRLHLWLEQFHDRGVLSHKLVLGEMMTCDIEYKNYHWMFNILSVMKTRKKDVTEAMSFNGKDIHVKLNKWKYVNGLYGHLDGANSPIGHWEPHGHLFLSGQGGRNYGVVGPLTNVGARRDAKPFEHGIWMMQAQVIALPYPWILTPNLMSFSRHIVVR